MGLGPARSFSVSFFPPDARSWKDKPVLLGNQQRSQSLPGTGGRDGSGMMVLRCPTALWEVGEVLIQWLQRKPGVSALPWAVVAGTASWEIALSQSERMWGVSHSDLLSMQLDKAQLGFRHLTSGFSGSRSASVSPSLIKVTPECPIFCCCPPGHSCPWGYTGLTSYHVGWWTQSTCPGSHPCPRLPHICRCQTATLHHQEPLEYRS